MIKSICKISEQVKSFSPFCNSEKFIEYDPFSKENEFYEGIENEEKAKEKSREWYLNWINYMREQIK